MSTVQAGEVLAEFARDVGVPTDLRADLASYFTGRNIEFVKEAKRLRIKLTTYAEKGRHNQNHAAEREIRDLKRRWHNKMVGKNAPKRLWDFGLVHQSEIMSRMSRGRDGRTGYESITGETPDISEWLDFDFYD
jgi:predicted GIY-YIG superfamily endonuclease